MALVFLNYFFLILFLNSLVVNGEDDELVGFKEADYNGDESEVDSAGFGALDDSDKSGEIIKSVETEDEVVPGFISSTSSTVSPIFVEISTTAQIEEETVPDELVSFSSTSTSTNAPAEAIVPIDSNESIVKAEDETEPEFVSSSTSTNAPAEAIVPFDINESNVKAKDESEPELVDLSSTNAPTEAIASINSNEGVETGEKIEPEFASSSSPATNTNSTFDEIASIDSSESSAEVEDKNEPEFASSWSSSTSTSTEAPITDEVAPIDSNESVVKVEDETKPGLVNSFSFTSTSTNTPVETIASIDNISGDLQGEIGPVYDVSSSSSTSPDAPVGYTDFIETTDRTGPELDSYAPSSPVESTASQLITVSSVTSSSTSSSTSIDDESKSISPDLIDIELVPPSTPPPTESTIGAKIFMGCLFASFIIALAAVGFCCLNVIGLMCFACVRCVIRRYRPKPTMDLRRDDDLSRSLDGDIKLEVLASYDMGVSMA